MHRSHSGVGDMANRARTWWCQTLAVLAAGAVVGAIAGSGTGVALAESGEQDQHAVLLHDEQEWSILEDGGSLPFDHEKSAAWEEFVDAIALYVDDKDTGAVPPIDGKSSRFGSIIADKEGLAADIYWAGGPPAALVAIIAEHPTVRVTFHESRYSLADLIEARDAIADQREQLEDEGIVLQYLAPARDASGLRIEATSAVGLGAKKSTNPESVEKRLEKKFKVDTDLTIDPGLEPAFLGATRQ